MCFPVKYLLSAKMFISQSNIVIGHYIVYMFLSKTFMLRSQHFRFPVHCHVYQSKFMCPVKFDGGVRNRIPSTTTHVVIRLEAESNFRCILQTSDSEIWSSITCFVLRSLVNTMTKMNEKIWLSQQGVWLRVKFIKAFFLWGVAVS